MNTAGVHAQANRTLTPPMGLLGSVLIFGLAGVLLYFATGVVIPALAERTEVESVLLWFLAGGLGVLTPLVIVGLVIVRLEGPRRLDEAWRDRMRFRRMDRGDWWWTLGGLVVVGGASAAIAAGVRTFLPGVSLRPSFLEMPALAPGHYWILLAWLPFWALNIMGEEVVWRGVVLPRQEVAFGRFAWALNALLWLLIHVSFGVGVLLALLPVVIVLPYIAQRRGNTWTAVVIHGALNAGGFISAAFGLV